MDNSNLTPLNENKSSLSVLPPSNNYDVSDTDLKERYSNKANEKRH